MARIFKLTQKAMDKGMDWDIAIYEGEIETVEEFDSIEDAIEAFDSKYCSDCDTYGVE